MAGEARAPLEWEARAARPVAVAAFVSALALVAGTIYQSVAVEGERGEIEELLVTVSQESADFVVATVLQSLSIALLAPVLWYLYRATRHRQGRLPQVALVLALVGPLLLAVSGIVGQVERIDVADEFAASGARTEDRAEDLLDDRSVVNVGLGAAGTLALAFSLVLISLNAMRVGLLSRFLGILGVIVGALYVLPVFGGPLIVQVFWLGALAALFLGRWPGGRPRAWETGEAVPWPSSAEQRAERERQALEQRGEPEAGPADPDEPRSPDEPRPTSRKRKRKRRG